MDPIALSERGDETHIVVAELDVNGGRGGRFGSMKFIERGAPAQILASINTYTMLLRQPGPIAEHPPRRRRFKSRYILDNTVATQSE